MLQNFQTLAQSNYLIDMFSTEQLRGTEILDFSMLKVKRIRSNGVRFSALTGPIYSHVKLDESYTSTFQYWRVSNVGNPSTYEPMPYILGQNQTFCEFYNSDELIIPGFLAASDLPPKGGCPFEVVFFNIFKRSSLLFMICFREITL
jgi:hypothetical protein